MPPSRDPHAGKSFRLLTLGTAALVDATGAPVAEQRRRIALLALVACSGARGAPRDKLIAYLSPDSSTDSARHALHQLLYYLRQQAGDDVFVGTDPLRLNSQLVSFDAAEFDAAYRSGALEQAAALYRGPFLDGFHLPESGEFEEWASAERAQLAARHREVLLRLSRDARANGDRVGSLSWSRALMAADPLSASAALEQMRALAASGDRASALRWAQEFQARLLAELGSPKDEEIEAYAAELRASARVDATSVSPPTASERTRPTGEAPAPEEEHSSVATSSTANGRSAGLSDGSSTANARASAPPSRSRAVTVGVLTVGALVAAFAFAASPPDASSPDAPRREAQSRAASVRDVQTIALMPIENAAEDSVQYLVRGIEQATLDRLSRVDGLDVISANVMRQYDARETLGGVLGRRVRANAVLNARVQRERDTLWLTLNVIRSDDGVRSGGGRLALTSQRLTAVESDIIDSVAIALGIPRIAHGLTGPRDGETYVLVMRAAYYLLNRDPSSLRRARELLNQAIERDPAYAEAHARLSGVYGAFAEYGVMPPQEAYGLSMAAARTALQLDPTSAMALASIAFERGARFREWREAADGLRRAAALEPWRAATWNLLGTTLRRSGRFDEALEATRRAHDLEPLARHYNLQIGHVFRCAGQLDSALVWMRRASSVGAPHQAAHEMLSEVLAKLGRHEEALIELRKSVEIAGDSALSRALHGLRGQDGLERAVATRARSLIPRILAQPPGLAQSSTRLAELYAQAGDTARSFAMLERALAERHPNLANIACAPAYDSLRGAPRFLAVLRSMNLAPSSHEVRR